MIRRLFLVLGLATGLGVATLVGGLSHATTTEVPTPTAVQRAAAPGEGGEVGFEIRGPLQATPVPSDTSSASGLLPITGSGGLLPITGSGGRPVILAAGAVIVLVVGAMVVRLSRRRRSTDR